MVLKLAINMKTNVSKVPGFYFVPNETLPLMLTFIDKEEALRMLAIPHLIGQRRIPFQYHEFGAAEDFERFIDSIVVTQPTPENESQAGNGPVKKPVQQSANLPEVSRPSRGPTNQHQDVAPNSARNLPHPHNQGAPAGYHTSTGNPHQHPGMPVGEPRLPQGSNPPQEPSMTGAVAKGPKNRNPEQEAGQNQGLGQNRPQIPRVQTTGNQQNSLPQSQRTLPTKTPEPTDSIQLASHRSRPGVIPDSGSRQSSGPSQAQFYQSDWPTDQPTHARSYMEENYSQNSSEHRYPDQSNFQPMGSHRNPESEFNRSADMSFSSNHRSTQRGALDKPSRYGQQLHFSPDSQGRSMRHVPGAVDSSGSSRVGSEDVASQSLSYSRKQSVIEGPGENANLEGQPADSTRFRASQDPRYQNHQGEASSLDAAEGNRPHHPMAQIQEENTADLSTVAHATRTSQQFTGTSITGAKQVPPEPQSLASKQSYQQPEQETMVKNHVTSKQPNIDTTDLENFPMLVPRENTPRQQTPKTAVPSIPKEVHIPFKDYEPQFSLLKSEPTEPVIEPLIPELHPLGCLREGQQTEATLKIEASLQGSRFKPYLTRQHMGNTYYLYSDLPKETWHILGGNTNPLRRELATRHVNRNLGHRIGLSAESSQQQLQVDEVVQIFSEANREQALRRHQARLHHEQLKMQTHLFLSETGDQVILGNAETAFISKNATSRNSGGNEGDRSRDGKTNSTSNSQSESKEPQIRPAF